MILNCRNYAQTVIVSLLFFNLPVYASRPVVVINGLDDILAKMVTSGTIYEICQDIDLQGNKIEIPSDCTIKFVTGSLCNGTIVGSNTYIENTSNSPIFSKILIPDKPYQFSNDFVYVDWFEGIEDADKTQSAIVFASRNRCAVAFLSRIYTLGHTVEICMSHISLHGTATGGEFGSFGTMIVAAEDFKPSFIGGPLFYITSDISSPDKGKLSGLITGLNFSTGRKYDAIQFLLSSGPSRPFYFEHCGFFSCDSAIRILDNGESTALGFLYVESCSLVGNKWNILAHGRHSLLGLYFCKNLAEQCDGNINLGYSEQLSLKPFDTFKPKRYDYAASATITVCDNLLEGTVDCIYINGGKCIVTIERNYFETSRHQFVVLSFSNPQSTVHFDNNYISHGDDVDLTLKNCKYKIQSVPEKRLHIESATILE